MTLSTTAAVREVAPGVFVIDIAGDVTAASEAVLVAAYTTAAERGAHATALNFLALDYMNSGGIGLLVMLLVRARRENRRVLAFGLAEHYREIFELTRLDEAISIHATQDDAVQAAVRS